MTKLTSKLNRPIRILIVEDEAIQAIKLEAMIVEMGYDIAAVTDNAADTLHYIRTEEIDLVLMDIIIKGEYDGIETVEMILQIKELPVIFMTSYNTEKTFERAVKFDPEAFIVKPFTQSQLKRCIQIAINRMADIQEEILDQTDKSSQSLKALFIRKKQQIIRVLIEDIYYLEADGKYSIIYTKDQKFMLRQSLSSLAKSIDNTHFVNSHRSYIVNIKKVDSVNLDEDFLLLEERKIPMSRREKANVLKQFNYLN